ncbi:MAG: hypothetical protein JSU74_02790 [Candidatus Zixiibacteriota bacterium]|nr:MAG: hypothetical protein JSU74_02790 [candidate division Zixibacteria bacterium]
MKSFRYIFVLLFLLGVGVEASTADGGIQSPFALGAGARELALGGTGLVASDAATAPYWNASRLTRAEYYSVAAFHCRLFDSDVAYQYFGMAVPTLDFGSFGFGIFRLGISGIERRDESNLLLDEFDDNRLGFYLAYGRMFSGYDIGFAAGMESHSLADYSTTSTPGLSLSIGRTLHSGWGNLTDIYLSVGARNLIAPSMKLVNEKVSEPTVADVGLSAVLLPGRTWDQSLSVSMALTKAESVDAVLAMGLEYDLYKTLYVRGGIRDDRLSFGVGLRYSLISFDYALLDRDLGSIHMFSLTSDFGRSVSERRQQRQQEREARFAQLMEDQMTHQNQSTMDDLVATGKTFVGEGELAEAVRLFDRALFFARASGADTVEIASLMFETQDRLERQEREAGYRRLIDSARVAYGEGRYLVARHLAHQAAGLGLDSNEAASLVQEIDAAINRAENTEDVITTQLWLADSLTSYGELEQALRVIRSLSELAPADKNVQLARKKVRFEMECAGATSDFESERYEAARKHMDSALAIFPGHQWCLQMKSRITQQRVSAAIPTTSEAPALPNAPLTASMQKEVERCYRSGQDMFAQGQLQAAVTEWEKVLSLAGDYLSVRQYLVKAYKFIGVDLYGQNRLDEAVGYWKKAMQLSPANEEIAGYIKRAENEIRHLKELSYDVRE